MMHKIRVGSKVNYNNLICMVTGIEHKGSKEFLELQPNGSTARISVESNQVNLIMNEGTKDTSFGEPLYD